MLSLKNIYISCLFSVCAPLVAYKLGFFDFIKPIDSKFLFVIPTLQIIYFFSFLTPWLILGKNKTLNLDDQKMKKMNILFIIIFSIVLYQCFFTIYLSITQNLGRSYLAFEVEYFNHPLYRLILGMYYALGACYILKSRKPLLVTLLLTIFAVIPELSRTPFIFFFGVFVFTRLQEIKLKQFIVVIISYAVLVFFTKLQGRGEIDFIDPLLSYLRYSIYSYYLSQIMYENFNFFSLGGGLGYIAHWFCDNCFNTSNLIEYHILGDEQYYANVVYSSAGYFYSAHGLFSIFTGMIFYILLGLICGKKNLNITSIFVLLQLTLFTNNVFFMITLNGILLILSFFMIDIYLMKKRNRGNC